MEINAEKLSEFLYEKIKHHEKYIEDPETVEEPNYIRGYHTGWIIAYERIIKEFNLQRLF